MSEAAWASELRAKRAISQRKSYAAEAADALREFILLGKLKAGMPVREREMAEALGVSRTPLKEALRIQLGMGRRERQARAVELFEQVGIPDPEKRLSAFPHQMSGGMNQRVMIAMAIACRPKLLIADEPTTALDVTIQAQILDLLATLRDETGMGLVLITHDMGVVAETAERVSVQYAGQKIEEQSVAPLFGAPHHPYTSALLDALPERATERRLPTIPGVVPGQFDRPEGCLFSPRCKFADARCKAEAPPPLRGDNMDARCFYPLNVNERAAS